jgi:hypothetical protein
MLKPVRLLLLATAALVCTPGCDNEDGANNPVSGTQIIEYSQGGTSGTVLVKVVDSRDFTPIAGVEVVIAGIDTAATDSAGFARFDSIAVGSYLIALVKEGYEALITPASVTTDENSNEVPIVMQTTLLFALSRQGVSVTGKVYYQDEDTKIAAGKATVELRLVSEETLFANPLRTTLTIPNGEYFFDDLPENTPYSIMVRPFQVGDRAYKQQVPLAISDKTAGDTVCAAPVVLTWSIEKIFTILSHNLNTLSAGDSLGITFSEPVDTSLLTPDSIYVMTGTTTRRLLVNLKWAKNMTVLQITPYQGTWSESETYRLYIRRLRSTEGSLLGGAGYVSSMEFRIAGPTGTLGTVKNVKFRIGSSDTLKIDYSTSSVTLYWTKLADAAWYEIYTRDDDDGIWSLLSGPVTDTLRSITTSGQFVNGDSACYMVLGANTLHRSDPGQATVLVLKDEKEPYVSFLSPLTFSGFNNASYTLEKTVTTQTPSFPEPMDTTKVPTFEVVEASTSYYGDTLYAVSADMCEWQWISTTLGQIRVTIDARQNGTYDTLKVDCSSFTDIAGNAIKAAADSPVLKYSTR